MSRMYFVLYPLIWVNLSMCFHKLEPQLYKRILIIDNNITGTGDNLKDINYNSQCFSLNCSNCCHGPFENITCASDKECFKYNGVKQRRDILRVTLIFVIPYLLIPILWIIQNWSNKQPELKFSKFITKFFYYYVYIMLPPYGIYTLLEYIFKCPISTKENGIINNSQAKKTTQLFYEKEFQACNLFSNGDSSDSHNIEIEMVNHYPDINIKEILETLEIK